MTNIVAGVSKYLIILLIAIYTYYNFRYFIVKDEDEKDRACGRQVVCMFMLHFLANLVIYTYTGSALLIVFYAAQVVFFLAYTYLYRLFYRHVSRILVNNMCMLLATGFIMLTRLNMDYAIRQFLIAAAAALVTWIIPLIMDRVWQLAKFPYVYAFTGIALLIVVWIIGNTVYGSQLSLSIAGITFQPSEFIKITYVFFIASMFYRSTDLKSVVVTTVLAAAHVLILVISKDLGSALIFFVAYIVMLYVATSSKLYLFLGIGGGSAAAVVAAKVFPHVARRVSAWLDPWSDVADTGYQIAQSLFAIGTGGWFGMGLYMGMPEKIPVVEKDFIFAAISEELGGIYAICLLFICLGCFIQFMMIASKMRAMFYKLLAMGLGTVYITQVFLTIGGVTKFIPLTGVTLPFVSYGGSSMLSTFIIFSVIQGLYILKMNEEEEESYEKDEAES